MGILDGVVEWISEQIMHGLDLINTSVLGALGCGMDTFLRYFPAAETMYDIFTAIGIGLILLMWVWNLFKNYWRRFRCCPKTAMDWKTLYLRAAYARSIRSRWRILLIFFPSEKEKTARRRSSNVIALQKNRA